MSRAELETGGVARRLKRRTQGVQLKPFGNEAQPEKPVEGETQ